MAVCNYTASSSLDRESRTLRSRGLITIETETSQLLEGRSRSRRLAFVLDKRITTFR